MGNQGVVVCLLVAIATGFSGSVGWAQEVASAAAPLPPPPPSGVVFKSVRDLKQEKATSKSGDFMLRGGSIAESLDWPASVYFTYDVGAKTYTCTGALVGPSTLMTAGHCVPADGKVSMVFGKDSYNAVCVAHASYAQKTDLSADFGLCRLLDPFKPPLNFKYERVRSVSPADLVKTKEKILLGGFGCTKDSVLEATFEKLDHLYRIGFATVKDSSLSKPPTAPELAALYAPFQNFNVITAMGQANLCPGDSGGPVFLLGPTGYLNRSIIAVNSRVLYADYPTNSTYGASVVAALGAAPGTGQETFEAWAKTWAGKDGAICGLVGAPPKCREP